MSLTHWTFCDRTAEVSINRLSKLFAGHAPFVKDFDKFIQTLRQRDLWASPTFTVGTPKISASEEMNAPGYKRDYTETFPDEFQVPVGFTWTFKEFNKEFLVTFRSHIKNKAGVVSMNQALWNENGAQLAAIQRLNFLEVLYSGAILSRYPQLKSAIDMALPLKSDQGSEVDEIGWMDLEGKKLSVVTTGPTIEYLWKFTVQVGDFFWVPNYEAYEKWIQENYGHLDDVFDVPSMKRPPNPGGESYYSEMSKAFEDQRRQKRQDRQKRLY